MYSYGSSARVAGGKRGHGGRPYRPPPDRSKQAAKPPPLKQCDCLVELELEEYLQPVVTTATAAATTAAAGTTADANTDTAATQHNNRAHVTFGSRQAMERLVQAVRSQFLCHLQIPGRNQGKPTALVAASVDVALPACHYVLQHLVVNNQTSVRARVHPNVKQNVPVLTGTFYKIPSRWGRLFVEEPTSPSTTTPWSVAVYQMTDTSSSSQLAMLQTCMDNLVFRDSSCQFQLAWHESTVFAMASETAVNKLLTEIQASMGDATESETAT